MADADIITTIALSGADDVAKELGGLGKAGEEAFQAIAKAATPLAGLLGEIGRAGSEAFKEIAGAVNPIEGAIAGAAAAFTGLFAAAKEATEAAHSLELLSLQAGASVESISALEGALVALGGSTEGISGAFRRMGTTIAREWDQIKKDVAGASDTIIGDALKVDKAQESVFKAQQARAKAFGERGASPMELQREKEKEATTALAEAEHAQAEAEKKQREDQMNSFDAYSKAVDSIIHGQKTFAEAGKDANLSVQNTLRGLIGNTEGAEEALKGFNGNLNSIVGESPKVLDVFKNLADFIKNSGDATQNQVLMTRLFGRTMGTELLPALSKGSAGIEEQEARIKALGLAITEDMTKPAVEFHEAYNRLTDDLSRTSIQASLKFDPAFTDIMKDFGKIVEENRGNIVALAEAIAGVVGNVVKLGEAFSKIGGDINSVIQGITKGLQNAAKAAGDFLGTTKFGPWLEKQLGLKPGTITPKPEGAPAEPGATAEPGAPEKPRLTHMAPPPPKETPSAIVGVPGEGPSAQPLFVNIMELARKLMFPREEDYGFGQPRAAAPAGPGEPSVAGPSAAPWTMDRFKEIFGFGGGVKPSEPAAAEPSILQKFFDMLPPLFAAPAKVEEPPKAVEKPSEAVPAAAEGSDKAAESLGKVAPPADATAESLAKVSAPADATAESLAKVPASADATETSLNKIPTAADAAAAALSKVGASGGEKPSAPATATEAKAGGGPVGGVGSGKSDSNLIRASRGEFVVTADGGNLGDAIRYFGGRHIPGFADGGPIGTFDDDYLQCLQKAKQIMRLTDQLEKAGATSNEILEIIRTAGESGGGILQGLQEAQGIMKAETELEKAGATSNEILEIIRTAGESGGGILQGLQKAQGIMKAETELENLGATSNEILEIMGRCSIVGKADGGPIGGWGSGKSDSVPIMASKGEFVVTADGSNLGDAISYFGSRHLPGFQAGGEIGPEGQVIGTYTTAKEIYKRQDERHKKEDEEEKKREEEDKKSEEAEKEAAACDLANREFNAFAINGVHRRAVGFENNPDLTAKDKEQFASYNAKYDAAEQKARAACEKAGMAFRDFADPHSLAALLGAQASDPHSLANLLGAQASQTASMMAGSGGAGWISGGRAEGGLIGDIPGFAVGGSVCEDCGETRVDTSRTVANLAQTFTGGGLVNGFVNSVATIPGYASGGPVSGTSGSSNTLSHHQLDIRTNAGTFSARVDEDTMDAIRNSALSGKLSQTGQRPSWFS